MTTLTPEQRQAVTEAGGAPVELADPQTGTAYVLVRADLFHRLRELLEEEEDRREQEAWAQLARRVQGEWTRENPY